MEIEALEAILMDEFTDAYGFYGYHHHQSIPFSTASSGKSTSFYQSLDFSSYQSDLDQKTRCFFSQYISTTPSVAIPSPDYSSLSLENRLKEIKTNHEESTKKIEETSSCAAKEKQALALFKQDLEELLTRQAEKQDEDDDQDAAIDKIAEEDEENESKEDELHEAKSIMHTEAAPAVGMNDFAYHPLVLPRSVYIHKQIRTENCYP